MEGALERVLEFEAQRLLRVWGEKAVLGMTDPINDCNLLQIVICSALMSCWRGDVLR